MIYDFETPVERRGTDSEKWQRYAGRDVLPLWVADMDFVSPPAVLAALRERVEHGVFGYGHPVPALTEAATAALAREFAWEADPDWFVWLPGLVSGLSVTCRAIGGEGDGVLINTPVYPPFRRVPGLMGRRVQEAPLAGDNTGGWRLDAAALAAAADERTRLYLLCHPHNPVGRLWTTQELESAAAFCLERDIVICSDEIHNQLVLTRDRRHTPLALLGPEVAARTITLLAPSKTYNIAGLGCSLAVIPDSSLRRRFRAAMAGIVPQPNVLAMTAAAAAWRDGPPWLAALLDHLRGNADLLRSCVARLHGLTMARQEATYLAWLDVRAWGLDDPAAHAEAHGLGLSDGRDFGAPGYLRLNFGCSRATLAEACRRLERAHAAADGSADESGPAT
jgi:cystathionine beta-lyase